MIRRLLRTLVLLLMPIVPPAFRQDDENLWRYYGAVMRVMRAVVHHVFMLLRPANNLTPKELLFALPGYSNAQYNRIGESVRQKLDDNVPTHEYDITLLYMLLQKVCGLSDEWSTPGTLQCSLKAMKDKRNQLAHEDLSLTRQELETRILELKALSRSVLEKTGQRVGQVVDDAIREMEAGMDEALTAAVDMWEPYRQGLQDLRQQQCSILVREGKKEMRALSERRRILNPFVWLLEGDFSKHTVDYVFTELTLQNRDVVNMSDLLQTTLPSGGLPETLIFSGTPGIGKSSLMRFILHEWVSGGGSAIQGLDAFELVLPVEARHVFSGSVTELVRYELLPNACQQLRQEDIVSSLQEVSLMWLLDGYDEASQTTKQVIREILMKFPHSKVLITTRPECAHQVDLAVSESHRSQLPMRIIGFSGNNVKVCTEKIFGIYIANKDEQKEKLSIFLKFLSVQNHTMLKIFQVPLYLTMLAVLWIDNPSVVSSASTGTRIFKVLIDHIINKMITREPFRKSGLRNRDLKKRLEAFLDTLGSAMTFHPGNLRISDDYDIEFLEDRCEELGLPFEETMSPFFTFIVEASTSGTKEVYSINHRTLGEFLLARVFCRKMISARWDVFMTIKEFVKIKFQHLEKCWQTIPGNMKTFYENFESHLQMYKLLDDGEGKYEDLCMGFFDDYGYDYQHYSECETGDSDPDVAREYLRKAVQMLGFCYIASYSLYLVSGYLKIEKALLPERAEQLCYIYSIIHNTSEKDFFFLITETEEDDCLLKQLLPHLSAFQWTVTHRNILEALDLLKYVTPQSVLLECSHKEDIQCIAENAQRYSEIPSEFDIQFRILYTNKGHETAVVLECLKTVLGESAKCTLASLCCPVDGACLALLRRACHLRELLVKVNTLEDAKLLAEVTRELPRLEFLEVVFDSTIMAAEPRTLPSFDVFQVQDKGKWKPNYRRRKKKAFSEEQRLNVDLVQFFCHKWRLPSAHCTEVCSRREEPSRCVGCHHSPNSLFLHDKFIHSSAKRWHRKCIRILRMELEVVERMLCVLNGGKRGRHYKFNPYARDEDQDGLWWCRLYYEVTRRLVRQHKDSVTLHHRLMRFTQRFSGKKKTVPIKLVFPDAFRMDPEKFGASVAHLCPNPSHVVLAGETEDIDHIKASQTCVEIYHSLSYVGGVTCVNVASYRTTEHQYQEWSRLTQRMSHIAPFMNISWKSILKMPT